MRADTMSPDDFKVEGQLGSRAIRVLIRVQELVSERGPYAYVEIGSYLGRSLQPHLQDADCTRALSIDLRPDSTPDERGALSTYDGVTAEDMVRGLCEVCSAADLEKLETLTDTSDALRKMKPDQFDLAFIDGEHTHTAAFRDFLNVMRVMRPNGVICFDDTSLVLTGILNALAVLEEKDTPHACAFGRGGVAVLALGARAEAFIEALGPDLVVPQDRVERRARKRISERALRELRPNQLTGNRELRETVIKALRKDGWRVDPAEKNEPA